MSGSFNGLSVALSALYAQRQGLEVTGQNIANVNTEGYTRQRAELRSVGSGSQPALFSHTPAVGNGVTVADVTRVRDALVESRVQTEHAQGTYLISQKQLYDQVEPLFHEPSDSGLQAQLGEFWSGWHDLANNPGDLSIRTQVLRQGAAVADTLRAANTGLGTIWQAGRDNLTGLTAEVNAAAQEVANLNRSIVRATQAGVPANDLSDQRDRLVLQLSELAGATSTSREDGSVDVFLSGSTLVSGGNVRPLEVTGASRLADQAADPVTLRFADNGTPAAASAGQLGAITDALARTLPAYAGQLDSVAASLAAAVNTAHAAGFDRSGAPGGAFFTGTTAATLTVAITDPAALAASGTQSHNPDGTVTGNVDGGNAEALALLSTKAGGPDITYRKLIADLGGAAHAANQRVAIQSALTAEVDNARSSVSGVSLDEEMTNMLSYQRAYQAAAKLMTAMDSMLDTLINRTGL